MSARCWPIGEAWEAASDVAATAYRIEPELLRAASRGRGPRPPARCHEAKKMAVHLAVIVSGCSYAELARHMGFHKSTIAIHCHRMRAGVLMDDHDEISAEALETLVRARLAIAAKRRIDVTRAFLAQLADLAEDLICPEINPSSSAHPSLHPSLEAPRENIFRLDRSAA